MRSGSLIPLLIALCALATPPFVRCQQGGFRQGALEAGQPQRIYRNDPQDSWNRIFYRLFTRPVTLRLTADFPEGAPFRMADFSSFPAFPPLRVSDRTFERIESGDRGIDPLYPSFLDSHGTQRLFARPGLFRIRERTAGGAQRTQANRGRTCPDADRPVGGLRLGAA